MLFRFDSYPALQNNPETPEKLLKSLNVEDAARWCEVGGTPEELTKSNSVYGELEMSPDPRVHACGAPF